MSAATKLTETHLHLDEDMIKTIDKAVRETFGSFLGINPELQSRESTRSALSEPLEVSGLISFIQDDIEGTLALRFSHKSVLGLLSKVYGEELLSIDNRVIGGVAEFANVIHGIAKEELNLQGFHYQMCLPVVIIGDNHLVATALSGQKVILNYTFENIPFVVELVIHNNKLG